MTLYLYEFQRKTQSSTEKYLLLTRNLVEKTSKCNPYIQIFDRNGDIRTYKLKFLVNFNCCESKDLKRSILNLSRKLKRPIKFENDFIGDDYQSKLGNEISAHQIDNTSCRRSSRRVPISSLKLSPIAAAPIQLTKITHNNLKNDYLKAAHLTSYDTFLTYLTQGSQKFFKPYYFNLSSLYNPQKSPNFLKTLALLKTANIQLTSSQLYWIHIDPTGAATYWSSLPIPYTYPNLDPYLYEPRLWELPDGCTIVLSKLSLTQLQTLLTQLNKHLT